MLENYKLKKSKRKHDKLEKKQWKNKRVDPIVSTPEACVGIVKVQVTSASEKCVANYCSRGCCGHE